MKTFLKYFFALFALLFVPLALAAQVVEPEPVKFTWHLIVALLAAIYEVVVRLIPTVGNYSWIAKVIDILKWISDYLNRKKK